MAYPTEPQVRSTWDGQRSRDWQDYHLSGMPELISSANLGQALLGLANSGLLARLREAPQAAGDLLDGLDRRMGEGFLRYLTLAGVLEERKGLYRLTRRGELLTGAVSLARLGFYLEAYAPVTGRITDLLTGAATYGVDIHRAQGPLARHCGVVSVRSYAPVVLEVVRERSARHLVDLGCGDGSLLVQLCATHPDLSGVGIDIAPDAIKAAQRLAADSGLGGRAVFEVADAFDPDTWPEEALAAEMIYGIGFLHERFRDGDHAVIGTLNRYAGLLTGRRTLLIGEPELRYDNQENDSDFFLVHVLTAQGIPRDRNGWLSLFGRTELHCRRVHDNIPGSPRTCFYELTPGGNDPSVPAV